MKVRDNKTKKEFEVTDSSPSATVITPDGERVTLHPAWIRLCIKQGDVFGGRTLLGTREMTRVE